MAARIRMRDAGGTLRTITQLRMRDAGGTLRTISRVRMRDASNTLRIVYDPSGASSLTATPDFFHRNGTTFGTGTATTSVVTVTASGGTAPYTYAWSRLSYDHPTTAPTATVPAGAATAFVQTNIGLTEEYTSEWRCTVTDSLAATATCDVTGNFLDVT